MIAHHLYDQAETFLMRLQRGSGVFGLSSIDEISERNGISILRPLLHTHPDDLKKYLNEKNIKWVEDESNQCTDFLRVKMRKFLPVLERIFSHGGEFFERYALITLLSEYIEEDYLLIIESYITRADTKSYYIHMAVAWLTAEILVKHYEYGVRLLKKGVLDIKTHNKAIQKATESYRLTNERKAYLRSLKIKKHIG